MSRLLPNVGRFSILNNSQILATERLKKHVAPDPKSQTNWEANTETKTRAAVCWARNWEFVDWNRSNIQIFQHYVFITFLWMEVYYCYWSVFVGEREMKTVDFIWRVEAFTQLVETISRKCTSSAGDRWFMVKRILEKCLRWNNFKGVSKWIGGKFIWDFIKSVPKLQGI